MEVLFVIDVAYAICPPPPALIGFGITIGSSLLVPFLKGFG